MKSEEPQTTIAAPNAAAKKEISKAGGTSLFGRTKYKFWALAAILLLAFWSMFTGSVTLKWSAGNLTPRAGDSSDFPIPDDLDILELEEREKVVRQMWDVYTHSTTIKFPRFWQEAFEAAYTDLTSEVPNVRNAAISEIARMSFWSADLQPPPLESAMSTTERSKAKKQAGIGKKGKTTTTSAARS